MTAEIKYDDLVEMTKLLESNYRPTTPLDEWMNGPSDGPLSIFTTAAAQPKPVAKLHIPSADLLASLKLLNKHRQGEVRGELHVTPEAFADLAGTLPVAMGYDIDPLTSVRVVVYDGAPNELV